MPLSTSVQYTTKSDKINIALMDDSYQQVHEIEKKSVSYKEFQDTVHIARKNSSSSCTTFSNDFSNPPEFRYSSDVLSIGGSSHYSGASSIIAASSNERNPEDVVTWLDFVGSELFFGDEAGYNTTGDTVLQTDDQLLQDTGINAIGRRRKIIDFPKKLENTFDNEAIPSNNSIHSSNSLSYRNGSECITNGSRCGNCHDSSSLNLLVSSLSLDEQLQCRSYCQLKGDDSIDESCSGCLDEDDKLTLYQLSQFNEAEHVINSRPIFETSKIFSKKTESYKVDTLTVLSTVAPPTPPPSLCDIKFEQPACESQCIQEGWIYKQSRHFKTWNKRWFALLGNKLYYFKNSKDMKVRGVVQLEGYRISLDPPSLNKKKRYGFNLEHDHLRSFSFYVNTLSELKMWVQILLKGTIKRNFEAPVISTNTDTTISLEVAQLMKPRPPSILMCSISEFNKRHQRYRDSVMRDVLNSNLEEELDETLLWVEHPHRRGTPFEALVIYPCLSINDSQNEQKNRL